jgi:hypothetical protein
MYCFVFVDVLQFGRFFRRARSFNLLSDGVRGVLAGPAAWQASAGLPAAIAAAAEEEEDEQRRRLKGKKAAVDKGCAAIANGNRLLCIAISSTEQSEMRRDASAAHASVPGLRVSGRSPSPSRRGPRGGPGGARLSGKGLSMAGECGSGRIKSSLTG